MLAMASAAAGGGDPQIGYGPPLPGLQDAQSEPAIAVDAGAVARGTPPAQQPLVVGANDYYDEPVCGAGVACSFKSGVGISGVYFSFDSVTNLWTGGTRWTGQGKLPYLGTTTRTEPMRRGRIVTVPLFEKRLASHGDPALAFGPRSVPGDGFAWNSGSRLYYATLAQPYKLPQPQATARQLIVVSRTDKVTA